MRPFRAVFVCPKGYPSAAGEPGKILVIQHAFPLGLLVCGAHKHVHTEEEKRMQRHIALGDKQKIQNEYYCC